MYWFGTSAYIIHHNNSRKALANYAYEEGKADGGTIRDSIRRTQNPVLINEIGLYRFDYVKQANQVFSRLRFYIGKVEKHNF